MSLPDETNQARLREQLKRLRGNPDQPAAASIIVPVNAEADLATVLRLLEDVVRYRGEHAIEVVLVINNYPPEHPPAELAWFRDLGVQVVAVPSARRAGEVVIVSARALGVQAANAEITIHFDADCHVPDMNALLNWYIGCLQSGYQLAYSHVGYYDLRKLPSVYVKIGLHHSVRWLKRNLFRIPTTRGSNYAVARSLFLQLYEAGKISVDLQIGPAAKLAGARIAYSGRPSRNVLTSGRRFRGGWLKMFRYFS